MPRTPIIVKMRFFVQVFFSITLSTILSFSVEPFN
jgi:hypothetical protein